MLIIYEKKYVTIFLRPQNFEFNNNCEIYDFLNLNREEAIQIS